MIEFLQLTALIFGTVFVLLGTAFLLFWKLGLLENPRRVVFDFGKKK